VRGRGVLGDRDPLIVDRERPSADLTLRLRALRGESLPAGVRIRTGAEARARRETRPLGTPMVGADSPRRPDVDRAGALVALGWPERVAGARGRRRGAFVLAGGRGAVVDERDPLAAEDWLAVASVDRGEREARVWLAAPVTPDELRATMPGAGGATQGRGRLGDGDVVAEEREELGAAQLARRPLTDPAPDEVHAALLTGLRDEGLELLRWTRDDRELQARLRLLHRELGAAVARRLDDAALQARLEEVVGPFLLRARRRADLARIAVGDVLRSQLSLGRSSSSSTGSPPRTCTVPSGRGSGSTTARGTGRCSRCGSRRSSGRRGRRRSSKAGSPCCSTCSHPLGDRCR
jgi:ATP-dependent helicase HrpB